MKTRNSNYVDPDTVPPENITLVSLALQASIIKNTLNKLKATYVFIDDIDRMERILKKVTRLNRKLKFLTDLKKNYEKKC